MLVPKELKFEHSGGVKAMTDEQLERSLEVAAVGGRLDRTQGAEYRLTSWPLDHRVLHRPQRWPPTPEPPNARRGNCGVLATQWERIAGRGSDATRKQEIENDRLAC